MSIRIAGGGCFRQPALHRPLDWATSWCERDTTSFVVVPAVSRWAARFGCRRVTKRTCSAPDKPASRLASSGRIYTSASAFTVRSDTRYGVSDGLRHPGAVTAAAPRVTIVGELLGRRLDGFGRLTETTLPHPRLAGVDTIRLTGSGETTDRIVLVAGFKWNVASTWLLTANVIRPITDVGLSAPWVPGVTFDYWFQ